MFRGEIIVGAVSYVPLEEGINYRYRIIEEVVRKNAYMDLICFGELFLNNNLDLYNLKKNGFENEKESEVEKVIESIRMLSKKYDLAISFGHILKEDNKFYIVQRVVFPSQEDYIYRKVHLGHNERKIFNPGDTIDVFHYKEYTFGIQICIDTHIQEMSLIQKSMGAEIIIAPFNTPYAPPKRLKNWSKYILTRSYEYNLCFICTNLYGGLQIINGYGNSVKSSIDTDTVESYAISFQKDFNHKLDFLSYRRPSVYLKHM
ncbi:nitrilase-related carbon-nitrogen hydrolase [Clostridium sp.]|uniref:nitrilase-related carbon-nitrogen hydrolase n=1 Tax=Clostridium sp. TaxID=1506 RepID=UPI003D6D0CB8